MTPTDKIANLMIVKAGLREMVKIVERVFGDDGLIVSLPATSAMDGCNRLTKVIAAEVETAMEKE